MEGPFDPSPDVRQRIGILYETYVCLRFETLGYRVSRTPVSGDQGADVLVYAPDVSANPVYAVQCKAWQEPVGISAIQEVYTARGLFNADMAVRAVASKLTADATHAASSLGVLTARLPIEGGGHLPVESAATYAARSKPQEAEPLALESLLSAQDAEAAALRAAFEHLQIPRGERRRWHSNAVSAMIDREPGLPPLYEVSVLLKRLGFWQTQVVTFTIRVEAGTGRVVGLRMEETSAP